MDTLAPPPAPPTERMRRRLALAFDAPVAANGYHWWYVDALSDDGTSGLTLIAFVGSVFSPYYAAARRRGIVAPERHCAINVALYATGTAARPARWSMTERGAGDLHRDARAFACGPSHLRWDGNTLTAAIDEVTCPWPSRLRGTLTLHVDALARRTVALDAAGRHRWRPIAPGARVEVRFENPRVRWTGNAYLDSNAGDEPLEDAFDGWHWSRARLPAVEGGGDDTWVLYDVARRGGDPFAFALRFDARGVAHDESVPPVRALPTTSTWRIARATRAAADARPQVLRTLEDTPFYARSLLATRIGGKPATAVHESLWLTRFRAPWVRALLPVRMPRRASS